MSNPHITRAQILIRTGARGTQAMWVAYVCPKTGRTMTAWGTVKTGDGHKQIFNPGSQPHTSLFFGHSKEASERDLNKLYNKKMGKYDSLGIYEIDVRRLRADPLGTDQTIAADHQRKSAAAQNDASKIFMTGNSEKEPLPRDITHPEAAQRCESTSPGWFF